MEIKYLTKLTKPGKIRAFFTVEFPDKMIIRDCKLIQNEDGSFFVGLPSRKYTDRDGKEKWTNIVEILDADLKTRISEMAKQEYLGPQEENSEDIPF